MKESKPIRILMAKPGLDGHDRGARVVVTALRDAGMEVTYTGLFQSPEQIVRSAIQEDVDVIGLSILSGAHDVIIPRIMNLLKTEGINDKVVLVGGIIPPKDIPHLKECGVDGVFTQGVATDDIVRFIKEIRLQRKGYK